MDKNIILQSLEAMQKGSKQRKFTQTVEFIATLRGLDLNKPTGQIDLKVKMPHATGKEKISALLFAKNKSFAESVKDVFSEIIMETEIPNISKQQVQKILAYDVILAEPQVMMLIGKQLGQQLAPRGKMPLVIADQDTEKVKAIVNASSSTIRVTNKHNKIVPMIQLVVGKEDMPLENLADNVLAVYDAILNALPQKKSNLKHVYVKKTMDKPIKIVEG